MRKVTVIDSHTEGEPTRLVVGGLPEPEGASIADRVRSVKAAFDDLYRPLLLEPRAYEAIVGAWIGPPTAADCVHDLIFFNPAGVLGMCGHGSIGLGATLAQTGELQPGEYKFNTPVGIVSIKIVDQATVQVENVASYRIAHEVSVDVDGYGEVVGDVAYGGNHFFLVKETPIPVISSRMEELMQFTKATMAAARSQGYADVNHVEVFGPPTRADANSKNYVLCPGGEYDRSPCGTGTSAKLSCLAADGKLAPGEVWTQESIIGTAFRAWYREVEGGIRPTIEGRAYVTGENTLVFDPADPLVKGIRR
jgi:4-hydroxyproline epimerase